MRLEDLRVINLSENRLTEKFVHFLVEARLVFCSLKKRKVESYGGVLTSSKETCFGP